MKFTKTYKETSFNSFYKPYYYVDDKRVSQDKFEECETLCKLKGLNYNTSYLYFQKNNRIKAVFHYN